MQKRSKMSCIVLKDEKNRFVGSQICNFLKSVEEIEIAVIFHSIISDP